MKYIFIFATSIILSMLIAYAMTETEFSFSLEIGRGMFLGLVITLLFYAETKLQRNANRWDKYI